MPAVFGFVLLAGGLMVAGCGPTEPAAAPPAVAAEPSWKTAGDAMLARIKPGMTTDEVRQALGKPKDASTVLRGNDALIYWEYEVTTNVLLRVMFDRDGKVLTSKIRSPIPIL